MLSILNVPVAEIPFHFLCFPIIQRVTLLAHILTHPCLANNPIITQLVPLYWSYVIVCLLSTHLIIPLVPIEVSEALDSTLSVAHSTIFVLLVDRGLDQALKQLPHDELGLLLHTILLLRTREHYFFIIMELSSIILGWAILMKRPMSFQVSDEMKIAVSE